VYDTVYNDIDDSTMALTRSMFKKDIAVAGVKLKQHGDVDCEVFSVAIATSLQHSLSCGLSPGPYVQALLRPHKINCFVKKLI